MGKVVHINDDTHARAKEFCKKNGIRLKDWISKLVERGVLDVIPITRVGPVQRKTLPKMESGGSSDGDAPPFWADRE